MSMLVEGKLLPTAGHPTAHQITLYSCEVVVKLRLVGGPPTKLLRRIQELEHVHSITLNALIAVVEGNLCPLAGIQILHNAAAIVNDTFAFLELHCFFPVLELHL